LNWNNLRHILGDSKTLSPGGVLGGSAAFILDGVTPEQFRQFKSIELVAVDLSGGEIVNQFDFNPHWIAQAEDRVVADRDFLAVAQEVTWR
jgi:hypothetical protein